MNKSKQKSKPFYDPDVLNKLHELYGYSKDYIRKSIRGDRTGIIPERLKKQYNQMIKASKKAKEEQLKEIIEEKK